MAKPNQAKLKPNGLHGIVKRLPVLIQAREILEAVLVNELHLTNAPKRVIEGIAAQYRIGKVEYRYPYFHGKKAQEEADNYYNQVEQALALCIRRFPDFPTSEFIDEATKITWGCWDRDASEKWCNRFESFKDRRD